MPSKAGTWKMRNLTGPCPSCGSNMPFEFHSSCRLRASWTPAERAAFDARDDELFALEASVRLEQYGPEELHAESPPRKRGPAPQISCCVPRCLKPADHGRMCWMHRKRRQLGQPMDEPPRWARSAA
jgi:hypothetical protein